MPKIFSKDCKIKVIEYGASSNSALSWSDLKSYIQALIPAVNVLSLIKRG